MTTATATTTHTKPNVYARVMVQAMKCKEQTFSATGMLHQVNQDGHQLVGIKQVLEALNRMVAHGLLERRALGMFCWKE
jgi:hypothetical protein